MAKVYKCSLEQQFRESVVVTFLCEKTKAVALVQLVLFPDRFFPFLFVVAENRVWWISVGILVLLVYRFWRLLIGVDIYKGLF